MGRPTGRSCCQYRGDLVLSHEEPEHALLNDSDVLWPPWFDDFPVGRHGQPIQRTDQRRPRSIRNGV